MVELFIHTRAGLGELFAADAASRRGIMQQMYADGLVLCEPAGAATRIKQQHAEEALREGPGALAPATVESRRYALTDELDGLVDAADAVERLVVANVALSTADLLFDHRRAWTGSGKWLSRRLLQADPEHGGAQLVQADEDTGRDVIHRFNEFGLAWLDPQWAGALHMPGAT
ncbi:hypothetical protein [Streptomyces erythrochromogenes]